VTHKTSVAHARYTFVYTHERTGWLIAHLHSSLMPQGHWGLWHRRGHWPAEGGRFPPIADSADHRQSVLLNGPGFHLRPDHGRSCRPRDSLVHPSKARVTTVFIP